MRLPVRMPDRALLWFPVFRDSSPIPPTMSAIHVPAKTPVIDSVIPDCCNTGVVFRALLFVNLAVLVAILLRSADWMRGALDFIESSPAVELACLLSLIVLCGLRQLLPSLARWGQR